MVDILVEVAGWAGGIALLGAYFCVSRGVWTGHGAAYQLTNLAGAAALAVNSAWNAAWPSTALNIVWIGLGLWTLRQIGRGQPAR
ncbi:MAG: hypothetical protein EAZ99_05975 [Alphaproteobacteria bacterium]|nr:hypothetical protein [Alphaproteobacteria bacterium]TAD90590.1 MAG: hypothetical protein EAZ99_05975 [Alphaproteobacteria bacterium]